MRGPKIKKETEIETGIGTGIGIERGIRIETILEKRIGTETGIETTMIGKRGSAKRKEKEKGIETEIGTGTGIETGNVIEIGMIETEVTILNQEASLTYMKVCYLCSLSVWGCGVNICLDGDRPPSPRPLAATPRDRLSPRDTSPRDASEIGEFTRTLTPPDMTNSYVIINEITNPASLTPSQPPPEVEVVLITPDGVVQERPVSTQAHSPISGNAFL